LKFIKIYCEKEQEEIIVNPVQIVTIKESKIYEDTGTIALSNGKEVKVSGQDWKKLKASLEHSL